MVTPAGPMFFWAPAKTRPMSVQSNLRLRMSELMSTTRYPLGLAGLGKLFHCVP